MRATALASRLGIGTVQFGVPYGVAAVGGQVSADEGHRILRCARAAGIDTLDTAVLYGESEKRLGSIGVDGWQIVTKLPPLPESQPAAAWVDREVEGSLKRLGVKRLRGLLLHRPAQLLERHGQRLYDALLHQKDRGVVDKIGVSVYDGEELEAITSRFSIDLVQAPFNLLDDRLVENGWLDRLASIGIELHVRSIFLQGLLLMASADRPAWTRQWQSAFDAFDAWLVATRQSPIEACLHHVLAFAQIARVVVGVDSAAQLDQILAALDRNAVATKPPAALSVRDAALLNPANWPRMASQS